MPEVNPSCVHLSASSIGSFKACPTRFRLAYREGLRPAIDTESQRVGTNWHAMHEEWARAVGEWVPSDLDPDDRSTYAMNAVVAHLNERYANVPATKTPEEWDLERTILLMSFIAYQWYWTNDPVEFIASELPFELPIHNPNVGLPLPMDQCVRVGKIDHVIKWQGAICSLERKSTSRAIGADSDYWDKAKKDTQVSMYALAFADMLRPHESLDGKQGRVFELPDGDRKIFFGERYGNTLYDVWHKPTIKPKMLTQAETAAFIESGKYMDQQFNINHYNNGADAPPTVAVNGVNAEVEVGKKGFAIRETVEMYGARLLQDIYARPDFYFQRREIARTDAEIRNFRRELWAIYQAQKQFINTGCWYENEQQCRATFACQYIPICYGVGANAVCDGVTTPPNFKRIFVDLTVNGVAIDEE